MRSSCAEDSLPNKSICRWQGTPPHKGHGIIGFDPGNVIIVWINDLKIPVVRGELLVLGPQRRDFGPQSVEEYTAGGDDDDQEDVER